MRLIGFIVLGIVLGIFYAKFLFLGAILTLTTWAAAGILVGIFTKSRNETLLSGAVYGFVVSFAFLLADYSGKHAIVTVLFPFALLSLFGAGCGIVLGFIGIFCKKMLRKKP